MMTRQPVGVLLMGIRCGHLIKKASPLHLRENHIAAKPEELLPLYERLK